MSEASLSQKPTLFGDSVLHNECDARHPFLISGSADAWIVLSGRVDVFFVRLSAGDVSSARTHVACVAEQQAFWGSRAGLPDCAEIDLCAADAGFLAVGTDDTRLLRVTGAALRNAATEEKGRAALLALAEGWIAAIGSGISPPDRPADLVFGNASEVKNLRGDGALGAQSLLWAYIEEGRCCPLGRSELSFDNGALPFPLAGGLWLSPVGGAAQVRLEAAAAEFAGDALWPALADFHRVSIEILKLTAESRRRSDQAASIRRAEIDQAAFSRAIDRLSQVLDPGSGTEPVPSQWAGDPLVLACETIAGEIGVNIKVPHYFSKSAALSDQVMAIAAASGIRTRRVRLENGWWQSEAGPLLCFREVDGAPLVALLNRSGRYDLINPALGLRERLGAPQAGTLLADAISFYRRFADRALDWRDLIRMGRAVNHDDLRRLSIAGAAAALLGLTVPIAASLMITSAIPYVETPQILALMAIMLLAALGAAAFNLLRAVAMTRMQIKLDAALQSAVWDHLLRLPAGFFRSYTAGDLADRAMGLNTMRQLVSDLTLASLLAGIFSLFNISLIFFFDVELALTATALAVLAIALIALCARWQLRHTLMAFQLRGRINGLVLQFLGGMAKLRAANAERRAFVVWAQLFAQQRRASIASGGAANLAATIGSGLPAAASIALFAAAAYGQADIPVGTFVAVSTAFAQFIIVATGMANSIGNALVAVPLYQRTKPILETAPEVTQAKEDPGPLRGKITISRVSFRYLADGPLTLDDVSLHAEPGDFIALVGPSGSGKSTLMRMLLGFEKPEFGNVYFDDKDLAKLDLRAVRRQMGVVVQNASLLPGDIFTNIVGTANLTVDDAWEAARMAGLHQEIRAMPMGMHTIIAEGMSTISGGQRQRLLIARALVRRPRIVLFDEATSALDNRTQAIVTESLETLRATRIVIAHRLSTVQEADQVYVMANGRIAESGHSNELMAKDGIFAALARRQIV